METPTVRRVTVIPGDGIGQEVMEQALLVMKHIELCYGHRFETQMALAGGSALDALGIPLPPQTLHLCKQGHAVLLGAVGGPKWEPLDFSVRPERGLLKLRSELQLYANLRPAVIYGDLVDASTLKREVVEGTNIMVIRELTGGIYFGQPRGITTENGERTGRNTLVYSESEIQRIAKVTLRSGLTSTGTW